MRSLNLLISLLVCLTSYLPTFAAPDYQSEAIQTVTLVGDFQEQLGCASDWAIDCGLTELVQLDAIRWHGTLRLPAGTYTYQVAVNHDMAQTYGQHGELGGDPIELVLTTVTDVDFIFYTNLGRAIDTVNLQQFPNADGIDYPREVYVASDFQTLVGCNDNWSADCFFTTLYPIEHGVFMYTFSLPAGDYFYKIALNGTWDVDYGPSGLSVYGVDYPLSLTQATEVYILYDHYQGMAFDSISHPDLFARFIIDPTTVTLVGDFQEQLGCVSDWANDCALTELVQLDTVRWQGRFALAAGSYEYQIVLDQDANQTYGQRWLDGSPISFVLAEDSEVEFIFYTIGGIYDSVNNQRFTNLDNIAYPSSVAVAGSFQMMLGCGSDWSAECSITDLAQVGHGLFMGSFMLPAGSHFYKIALNDTWDVDYGPAGLSVYGVDYQLDLSEATRVYILYDHYQGMAFNSTEHPRIFAAHNIDIDSDIPIVDDTTTPQEPVAIDVVVGDEARTINTIPPHRRLAYASDETGDFEIYVQDITSSNPINITNAVGNDSFPSWMPGGQQIVFQSDRSGVNQLYIMDADGDNLHQLTFGTGFSMMPSVSPDGRIAYIHFVNNAPELFVMNSDGRDVLQLTTHGVQTGYPTWSPDGTQLAYHSDIFRTGDGILNLYLINADGTNQTKAGLAGEVSGRNPFWVPLSDTLIYETYPFSSAELPYIVIANNPLISSVGRLNEERNPRSNEFEAMAVTNYNETLLVYSVRTREGMQLVVADIVEDSIADFTTTNHRVLTSGAGQKINAAFPLWDVTPTVEVAIDGETITLASTNPVAYVAGTRGQIALAFPNNWSASTPENGMVVLRDQTDAPVALLTPIQWNSTLNLADSATPEDALAAYLAYYGIVSNNAPQIVEFGDSTFYAVEINAGEGIVGTLLFIPLENAHMAMIVERFPDADILQIAASLERTADSLRIEAEVEYVTVDVPLGQTYQAAMAGYSFNYPSGPAWTTNTQPQDDPLGRLMMGFGEALFPMVFVSYAPENAQAGSVAIMIPAIDEGNSNIILGGVGQFGIGLTVSTLTNITQNYYVVNGRFMQVVEGTHFAGNRIILIATALEDSRPVTIIAADVDRDIALAIAASTTAK